jgi:hypothetical protein
MIRYGVGIIDDIGIVQKRRLYLSINGQKYSVF